MPKRYTLTHFRLKEVHPGIYDITYEEAGVCRPFC
jgi:hypothetical protein